MVGKTGRNEPCPCGSGKKYKKCCLGREPAVKPVTAQEWDLDRVGAMSTEELLAKLGEFGVAVTGDEFVRQAPDFASAVDLAEDWYERYPVYAPDLDEDFIWMAATVLWRRLTPDVPSSEELDDMMQQGYELAGEQRMVEACRIWLEVWERLKPRFTPEMRSIRDAERAFEGLECLYNWCQDLEDALNDAGGAEPGHLRQRVDFCNEFCNLFPASDETIIVNMKRAAAESYFALGQTSDGDRAYAALVEEFPDNAWSYIGWGDEYAAFLSKDMPPDYERAERIYRRALDRGIQQGDRDVVLERLANLEKARKRR